MPQDYVLAHKWFTLVVAGGYKDSAKGRDKVEKRITPAQIAEAHRLAREWEAKTNK